VLQCCLEFQPDHPVGDLKTGTFDYSLKTEKSFQRRPTARGRDHQNSETVSRSHQGRRKVEDSYQEQTEIVRINGKPGVNLRVQKLANANTITVVDNVLKESQAGDIPQSVRMSLSFDSRCTSNRRSTA